MLTYMSSKSWGYSAKPDESGAPPSITSQRCSSTFLNSGFEHCSANVWIAERIVIPAANMDASWRVNGITSVVANFFAPLTLITRVERFAILYSPVP